MRGSHRTALAIAISLLVAFGLEGASARAADPGDLDRSFGANGRKTVNFGHLEIAWDVALQARKPILAGWTLVETGGCCDDGPINIALARLRPGGRLDSSFGQGGKKRTRRGALAAYAVAVQDNGKIVVAGGSCYVMRFKPEGAVDRRFGEGGIARPNLDPEANPRCRSLALQDDGRIVVAGYQYRPATGNSPVVLRYRRGGRLDESFAGDGQATAVLPEAMTVEDLAIQPDGRILVAGGTFAVARYTSRGEPDTSFSGDGIVFTDIVPGAFDNAEGIALSEDGIVVGGTTDTDGGTSDFALARYDLDGNLDLGFGGGGIQLTDFRNGGLDDAWGIAAQRDGKIVLAGSTDSRGKSQDFALARYLPDGTLDPSFSQNGKAVTAFRRRGRGRGVRDVAYGVAVDRQERILAVGSSGKDFAVARYHGG